MEKKGGESVNTIRRKRKSTVFISGTIPFKRHLGSAHRQER
jgi:hypothetical protein